MWPFKDKPLVEQNVLLGLGQDHPNTPDYIELSVQKKHLLFVGDEMMSTCRQASMLAKPLATKKYVAYTNRAFIMLIAHKGKLTYPVILPSMAAELPDSRFKMRDHTIVKGEVYEVETHLLVQLDNWKENGTAFNREQVYLDIPYRERYEESQVSRRRGVGFTSIQQENTYHVLGEWKHEHTKPAWMYVGNADHFQYYPDKELRPFRPKVPADNNKKPFYYYREDAKY